MTDRDISMFENMAYIILEDFTERYSRDDKDTLTASEPPEEDGRYLVLIISFSGKHTWQDVCKFANDLEKVNKFDFKGVKRAGWYDYKDGDYYEVSNITHWMPLPHPPKEVE